MAIAQYRETEGRWTTPNGRSFVSRYREGTNDWNTISACLTDDEYGLRGLNLHGAVLDVGGYLGSVGLAIALDYPDTRVTIIEPVPPNAELIRQNAERNGASVSVIEGAVGKGGEPVEVRYAYRGSDVMEHHAFVGNSSLEHDYDETHLFARYTAIGLAEMVEELGDIALLKIDCEGAEFDFLDDPAIGRVERIVGEAHAVNGHRGGDIAQLLHATHVVTFTGNPTGTCGFMAVRR